MIVWLLTVIIISTDHSNVYSREFKTWDDCKTNLEMFKSSAKNFAYRIGGFCQEIKK